MCPKAWEKNNRQMPNLNGVLQQFSDELATRRGEPPFARTQDVVSLNKNGCKSPLPYFASQQQNYLEQSINGVADSGNEQGNR